MVNKPQKNIGIGGYGWTGSTVLSQILNGMAKASSKMTENVNII